MNRNLLIRIGFGLFLFAIGFLVGAGLSKTVRYMSGNQEKSATLNPLETKDYCYC